MKELILFNLFIFLFTSCATSSENGINNEQVAAKNNKLSTAYFASGCFWCVEAVFESVKGVEEAVSGYAGGKSKNPNYRQVSAGLTDHAETVKIYYDSTEIDFATLVLVYYASHDPTTVNRQGPDQGRQYRSIAFYQNDKEKKIIENYITKLLNSGKYENIATEVVPFERFYKAEDYHQDYEKRNPYDPYVQNVSIPRLNDFKGKFPTLLK